eukprot:3631251-Ditylum_brightwellii.AAC.1
MVRMHNNQIWNYAQLRRKERNDVLHPLGNLHDTKTRNTLLQRLKTLCTQEMDIPTQDKFKFNKPIHNWDKATTMDINRWIYRNYMFIKKGMKLKQDLDKLGSKDIKEYYCHIHQGHFSMPRLYVESTSPYREWYILVTPARFYTGSSPLACNSADYSTYLLLQSIHHGDITYTLQPDSS